MKKVGIVSCYFQKNYGSMLQAYATQKILDDLGIENETICVDGFKNELNKSKLKHYLWRITEFEVIREKTGFIKNYIYRTLKKSTFGNHITLRNQMFDAFKKNTFRLSKVYQSREELMKNSYAYSAFLVGSDQLWLPSNIDADYYTLNFVPEEIKKISYATSFGVASLQGKQKETAKLFLKRIGHISVREQSGQGIIKQLTGRDVPIVCDPTLLLSDNDWMGIQKEEPLISTKYIFCYLLGNNPEQREFVKCVKKLTGLQIVALPHVDMYLECDCGFADITPYHIGPSEFINLIRNAEYVFTDSFHGSVFSILNQKKFFAFKRFKDTSQLSTNSRLDTLFKRLNLNDRLLSTEEDIEECLSRNIDYNIVDKNLKLFRRESKEYLVNSINAD